MAFYLCSLCPFLLFFSFVVYLLKILIPSSLPLWKFLISWVPCGLCSLSGYKLQSWFLRFLLFFTFSLFPFLYSFFFCPVYSDNFLMFRAFPQMPGDPLLSFPHLRVKDQKSWLLGRVLWQAFAYYSLTSFP